jgi:histidyl-tRNA synthetase
VPPAVTAERKIGLVQGTRGWLPDEFARLAELERLLLEQFRRAGYRPMRTPILEFSELHERKSGAGIAARLLEVKGAESSGICLRPELTAGIVRALAEAPEPRPLPFRVSSSGPVIRFETPETGRDREFTQVGVELIGAGGPAADAEVIWLADWSLRALGVSDASIRISHVGLILELLSRSGLPATATSDLAGLRGPSGPILNRLESDYAALAPESVAALRALIAMLGHHGVEPDRVELDLGFGRGIGFYTRVIFELTVPTPYGMVEVCGGGRYDGLARVLGSTRDDRGAGFAFGLERLLGVLDARSDRSSAEPASSGGYLVTSGNEGEIGSASIDLATFLRERINLPVVVSDLAFQAAIEQARSLGLVHVITVGRSIEVWNLEHGDVRSVREGDLIDQMRARLAVFRGDRS